MVSMYFVVGGSFFFFSIFGMLGGLLLYLWDQIFMVEYLLISILSVDIVYEVMFDWISLFYLGTVFFISGSVMIFSKDYSGGDKHTGRFIGLMVMFVVSMMLMVVSGGVLSVMLGWDGLGLVSYCLVIYYQSSMSYKAGLITIMSNRVGDVLILVGIGLMFCWGNWSFLYCGLEDNVSLGLIGIMMLVAACTKSAQVPFSAWLPEAMAAPTPVSSLVHSSTLVTAGVFLMVRFSYVVEESGMFLLGFGLMTMLLAGGGAMVEMDSKKVVAMSTLSQLGLSMFVLGGGLWLVGYFHSIMHAYFKALSFLSVGGIIYGLGGDQDGRMMGVEGLMSSMINQGFVVSVLCLGGFPFFCGFFSKDLILGSLFSGGSGMSIGIMFIIGLSMSIFYGIRLYKMSFTLVGSGCGLQGSYNGKSMDLGIFLLGVLSVFMGGFGFWSSNFFGGVFLMDMISIFGLMMFLFGGLYMIGKNDFFMSGGIKMDFVGGSWNLSVLSNDLLVAVLNKGSEVESMEQCWVEEMGGVGLYLWVKGVIWNYDFSKVYSFSIMMMGAMMMGLILFN